MVALWFIILCEETNQALRPEEHRRTCSKVQITNIQRSLPHPHLGLRLLASRTEREHVSVVQVTHFVAVCYGSSSYFSSMECSRIVQTAEKRWEE